MFDLHKTKVWDPFVRFFHWSLVSAFFIAYVSEDEFMLVHSWAGYLILGLIAVRFIWGFIGTHYARFSNFIYSVDTIKKFLKDTLSFKAKRYIGHNPAGGAMVIALMLSLLFTTITGILLFDVITSISLSDFWYEFMEEIHEFFANFTLLLIFIHVLGVVIESFIHKENLVLSMLDGFKKINKSHLGDEL